MTRVEFNPFLPEVLENPFPLYHRLRTEDPVHESPLGLWVLTRYDDVASMLRDARFGRKGFDALLQGRFGEAGVDLSLLFRDPPHHTRRPALVSRAFTPRAGVGMRARVPGVLAALLHHARVA